MALPQRDTIPESLHARKFFRDSDVSGVNSALTLSTEVGLLRRIISVDVVYSGSATANVDITVNSGLGGGYDNLRQTIALSGARYAFWVPDEEVLLWPDDVLDVLTGAGGAGVTSTVVIETEAV